MKCGGAKFFVDVDTKIGDIIITCCQCCERFINTPEEKKEGKQ